MKITPQMVWMVVVLLGAQPILGFVLGRALSPAASSAMRSSRMWVLGAHTVIGFALPLLAFIHAWQAMSLPGSRSTSISGLWIATIALLLLVLQAMIGLSLLRPRERRHLGIRRFHCAVAVFLIVLATAHVLLNSDKGEEMKKRISTFVICFVSLTAFAAMHPEFSGTWVFNPGKSQNIGMMSEMKMTQTIEQSSTSLDITSNTTFQGSSQQTKSHYDLSGKAVTNDSPMAGPSETVSNWDADKLVTTWTSKGAVAGTTTVRTEALSLSPDGRTMTVESARGSNAHVVMVFDKK